MLLAVVNLLLSFTEGITLWLCIYLFMKHNRREIFRRRFWYVLGFSAAGIGFYALTFWMNRIGAVWIPVIFYFCAVPLLGRSLFHKRSWSLLFDVIFSVLLFFGMEIGIFFMNLLFAFYRGRNLLLIVDLILALKIMLSLVITAVSIRLIGRLQEGRLKGKQTAGMFLLPVFSGVFVVSMLRMNMVYGQLYSNALLLINLILLVLVNCYFIFLFRYMFQSNQLEQELERFQAQNEVQYRYYTELERKYQESRKILHDMKNHLQAIESLYREDNASGRGGRYVKDLYHMVNILGEKYYSSDRMLNIICNDKLSAAGRMGIRVTAQIGDVDFSDLKDMDVTTIFANLLDNAIEAAQGTEGAFLDIKMQNVHQFRVISIVNAMEPGRKKPGHSGIGLENVRRTLEKYHGTIRQETVDGEYRVSVLLPKKEEKEE